MFGASGTKKGSHEVMLRLHPSSTTHPETIFIRTKTQVKFRPSLKMRSCMINVEECGLII